MHVSIAIVRALVEELELRGLDARGPLAELGFDEASLDDPLGRVDIDTYVALVDRALALTGDPRLGLAIGARIPTTTIHVVSHAALACRTLREAWSWFSRASRLVLTEGRFELETRDGLAALVYDHPILPPRLATYDAELCLSFILRVMRAIAPTGVLRWVELRHAAPDDISDYRRVFEADVRFGRARNAIVGDASVLDVPQRHADPVLFALLRHHTDRLLAELDAERFFAERVRHVIRSAEQPATLGAEDVARALNVSVHSLRRALAREGRSIRSVVDEALRELACSHLANPATPVKEVAYALGFSEPSAFHRAFKRWTGMTPAEFRASRGGG